MQRNISCVSMLITLPSVLLASSLVSAETVVIPHTDRGWYKQDGSHESANQNYFVGDYRSAGCSPSCGSDFHNFFVFDLSSLSKPIVSGTLALLVPNPALVPGYSSPDPSENYELHDVTTPIADLVFGGQGKEDIHADLGSGVVYGSRSMTAVEIGKVVEITLNPSAIAAMNSIHELLGIGGWITTLDAVANNEFIFAASDRDGFGTTELQLTLVPEPSSGFFCLAAIFATQLRRSRRRY